ncbi:glutathione S-transferase C-terminal domain-containing protein [Aquibium sp. LZ166]|uniref:Glutathione S-transferase C-terminal domain-containing protein n=1 Tax=Aquibium pacificus TaxID=3153579 RepID=A0ABV3SS05_9HYPH
MMKFYYSPGACSIGIHFLLEELAVPYEAVRIAIKDGEQFKPDYVGVNPKSKVPALARDDGSVLTEFAAIAHWLAHSFPEKGLAPSGLENGARAIEIMDYVVATIHMQGFSRLFRPAKFAPSEADHTWVQDMGREIVTKAFGVVSESLGDNRFILGDRLSMADSSLFYVLFWAVDRQKLDLPRNVADYYARLRDRPSSRKVFHDEGIVFA